MKNNRKTVKRHINILKLCIVISIFSSLSFLMSALFLGTYNNELSTKAQAIGFEIAALQTQNDALHVDIETLSSSDRVEGIAASNGMSRNQDSIITITDSSSKE